MNKIRYALALIYTDIKSRRPGGTPYFNLRFGMAFYLWLLVLTSLLLLKLTTHIDLIPHSPNLFMGYLFLFIPAVMGIITWLFPLKDLLAVDVNSRAVKQVKYYYFGCFTLTMFLMFYLLMLDANNPHYRF